MSAPPKPPSDQEGIEKDIQDLATGGLVTFVGKLGRLSRGGFIWVISLLCGLEVQGLYSLSWGIISTLNKISRFGLQRGVVRFTLAAETVRSKGTAGVVAAALLIGIIVGLAVVVGVALVAERIAEFYQQPIAKALRIMSWSSPFMAATWVFLAAIRALRIMRFEVYVMSVAGPLVLFVGGLVVGLDGGGIEAVAWVQLIMAVANCLLAVHYFRRYFSLSKSICQRPKWWSLARFSFPVMLTDLLYSVLTQLDVLMLGWFVSAKMVGIYALARRLSGVMLKAPQAFDPIFSSIVTELSLRAENELLAHRFIVISRWILMINLPIFIGILLVGRDIIPLLSANAWDEVEIGFKILFLLSIGMLAQGVFAIIEPLLAMSGRPYLNLYNNIGWLVGNFSFNLWLINLYGIVGAALGAMIAMVLVNVVRLFEVYWLYSIRPFHRSQCKPLFASLVGVMASLGVRQAEWGLIGIGVTLITFLGAYVLGLILLGAEKEDRILWAYMVEKIQKRIF